MGIFVVTACYIFPGPLKPPTKVPLDTGGQFRHSLLHGSRRINHSRRGRIVTPAPDENLLATHLENEGRSPPNAAGEPHAD